MGNSVGNARQTAPRSGEAIFLIVLLIAAAVCFADTFRFRVVPWDSLGLAFWPRLALGLLTGLACLRLWQLGRGAKSEPPLTGYMRGIAVLGLCLGYVVGFGTLGVYLVTPVFFVAFCGGRSASKWLRNAAVSLLVALATLLVVFLVFGELLGLRLISSPVL